MNNHEFGHKIYQQLSEPQRLAFEELWVQMGSAPLLYLFRDGEYSGNPKVGGHPYDSPEELFASAFNLLNNREKELAFRLQYVDKKHLGLIQTVKQRVLDHGRKQ